VSRYGTPAEHRAAHGLDARGIRASISRFLTLNDRWQLPTRKCLEIVAGRLVERRFP
jgi:hypothetical protein